MLVADLLEDPGARERLQAGAQDVAGDPQVALQLGEAADPEERLAHDQEGPALAENLHRAADRTWLMLHHVTVSRWRSRSSTATTTSCYAAGASGRAPARAPPHVRGRAQAARPRARRRAPRRALARGPAARARRSASGAERRELASEPDRVVVGHQEAGPREHAQLRVGQQ